MIEFKLDNDQPGASPAAAGLVSVIGIGGAGTNVLDSLAVEGFSGGELVNMNTEASTLRGMCPRKVQLGKTLTRGFGCGGDPDLGQEAAVESADEIRDVLAGRRMVFICAGLGGGTGSGSAPLVARMAREAGAFVVVFATLPFVFEGRRRMAQATAALEELRRHTDALITFENDRMGEIVLQKKGIEEAFAAANRLIGQSIRAVTSLVNQPGLIRIGMDDLLTALRNADSRCLFGYGQASGETRAADALAIALKSPLLDRGQLLEHARNVLVHVCGGQNLTLFEIESLMKDLGKHVSSDAQILFGAAVDPRLGDSLSVTVISSLSRTQTPLQQATATVAAPPPAPAPAPAAKVEVTPLPVTATPVRPQVVAVPPRQPQAPLSDLVAVPQTSTITLSAPVIQLKAPAPVRQEFKVISPPPASELLPIAPSEPAPEAALPEAEAPEAPAPLLIEEPAAVEDVDSLIVVEEEETVQAVEPEEVESLVVAATHVEPEAIAEPVVEHHLEPEPEITLDDEVAAPAAEAMPAVPPVVAAAPEPEARPKKFDLKEILRQQQKAAFRSTRDNAPVRPEPVAAEREEIPAPPPVRPEPVLRLRVPDASRVTPIRPIPPVVPTTAESPAAPATPVRPQRPAAEAQQTFDDHLSPPLAARGRFAKGEPTVEEGEDLDIPTFLRRKR